MIRETASWFTFLLNDDKLIGSRIEEPYFEGPFSQPEVPCQLGLRIWWANKSPSQRDAADFNISIKDAATLSNEKYCSAHCRDTAGSPQSPRAFRELISRYALAKVSGRSSFR